MTGLESTCQRFLKNNYFTGDTSLNKPSLFVRRDEFESKKIGNKLIQQVSNKPLLILVFVTFKIFE